MRRLLLYKTGQPEPSLIPEVGDYQHWFQRYLGDAAELEVHHAFEAPHRPLSGYDGLVISGSPRSLVDPEPWMNDAAEFVRRAHDAGVPVLGVCFGHQLIGYAFGGRVRTNPNGWEVGTQEVELTEEGARDPLFAGVPRRVHVNQSHRDEVWELGRSTRRLAGNAHSQMQAIAVGSHVRGVQFHPEIDGAVIKRLMSHRRMILADDMRARGRCVDAMIAASGDTPDARRVLRNFVDNFVQAA